MNKTISINIAGLVFNIEEQAFELLNNYLETIREKFHHEDDPDEIMEDIEARIAELFQEKISETKEVITEGDVNDVIDIMGHPEDYVTDDMEEGEAGSQKKSMGSESTYRDTSRKRLFRDPDNAVIGGVCSGIGHYFNLDPTIVRAIFVVLFVVGGSGFLLYLILLLIVPEAKSTADKLQMKGRSVNLGNIKEHVNEFKESTKEGAEKATKTLKKAVDRGVEASSGFVQALSKLIGVAFTLGGVFGLFALITIFFSDSGLLPVVGSEQIENLPTLIEILYPGNIQHNFIFIALMVVTILPVLSILIAGIKLLFDYKRTIKPLAITGLIIWLVGVGTLVITGIELGMNFRSNNEIEYKIPMKDDSTDVLFVNVSRDDVFSNHIEYDEVWNQTELVKVDGEKIHLGFPSLHVIQKDDSSNFEINIYKQSCGLTLKDAISKAEATEYNFKVKGNRIKLPPYYTIPRTDKLRAQEVTVQIEVPLGKEIRFGDNMDRINVWLDGHHYYYHNGRYANTSWISDYDGMNCDGCEKRDRTHNHDHEEVHDEDEALDED